MELLLSSLPASFVIGLSFGASACMFACIPTLGVALIGAGSGNISTQAMAARFNGGRLFGYSLLGLLSGSLGATLTQLLSDAHAALLFGALLIFAGLMLWRRAGARSCSAHDKRNGSLFGGSMFGIGLGMSLTPCLPLAGVCAAAAATASPWAGWLLGLAFGLGAIIPAQLLLGYGLGAAGQQLRSQLTTHATRLSRIASGILLLVGISTAMGWIKL
jgi:sulfite exporter TauE/SafE